MPFVHGPKAVGELVATELGTSMVLSMPWTWRRISIKKPAFACLFQLLVEGGQLVQMQKGRSLHIGGKFGNFDAIPNCSQVCLLAHVGSEKRMAGNYR